MFSCQKKADALLIGSWESASDSSRKVEFTEEGYFKQYIRGEEFKFTFLEEVNGEYHEVDYGNLIYKIHPQGDSLVMMLIGAKNNKLFSRHLAFLENNYLTLVVYKEGEGIDAHIQSVESFYKIGITKDVSVDYKSLTLIIPKPNAKKSGEQIYIAYGQPDGADANIDFYGNVLLDIPESGALKTKFVEDVKMISYGTVNALFRTSNHALEPVKVIQYKDYAKFRNEMKNREGRYEMYLDSMMVFVNRFNPSRDLCDKIFKEETSGNIQTFTINTPRNEYGLN